PATRLEPSAGSRRVRQDPATPVASSTPQPAAGGPPPHRLRRLGGFQHPNPPCGRKAAMGRGTAAAGGGGGAILPKLVSGRGSRPQGVVEGPSPSHLPPRPNRL